MVFTNLVENRFVGPADEGEGGVNCKSTKWISTWIGCDIETEDSRMTLDFWLENWKTRVAMEWKEDVGGAHLGERIGFLFEAC